MSARLHEGPGVELNIYELLEPQPDPLAVPPRLHRHPLRYPHVWFTIGGMVTQFLIFTSFIPTNAFEQLAAATFGFMGLSLIFSLTQDLRFRDNPPTPRHPRRPSEGGFWREHQQRAGIQPKTRVH